jgi:hypothetical protein
LVIALGASGCNTAKRLLAEVMKKGEETATSEPLPVEVTNPVPTEPAAVEATAPEPTQPEATAPAVTVEAANVAEVTRFDDEKTLEGTQEEGTTELPADVELRRAPEDGELVAKITKGAQVERLAERGEQLLILTADPAQIDRKVLGWLPKTALETPAPEPTAEQPVPSAPAVVTPPPKPSTTAPKTTPKPPPAPTTPPKASTPKPVTPPPPPKSTAPDDTNPKKKKKKKKGETLD